MKLHVALFCLLAFALAVLGCADSLNPLATENDPIRAIGIDGEREPGLRHVQPILLPEPEATKSVISTTMIVSPDSASVLRIEHMYRSVSGRQVWRRAWLRISPRAIAQNTEITMAFDTLMAGVVFQPEGLEFLVPARLDYLVQDLDPLSPGEKHFFHRKETEYGPVYFQMTEESLLVDDSRGIINLMGGEIPHFSRYVFGRVYGRDDVK